MEKKYTHTRTMYEQKREALTNTNARSNKEERCIRKKKGGEGWWWCAYVYVYTKYDVATAPLSTAFTSLALSLRPLSYSCRWAAGSACCFCSLLLKQRASNEANLRTKRQHLKKRFVNERWSAAAAAAAKEKNSEKEKNEWRRREKQECVWERRTVHTNTLDAKTTTIIGSLRTGWRRSGDIAWKWWHTDEITKMRKKKKKRRKIPWTWTTTQNKFLAQHTHKYRTCAAAQTRYTL